MTGDWGGLVLFEARACLERRMPGWLETGRRIVIYAAGSHTRDLFGNEEFARLNVVGIVDRNPALHGQRLNGREVFPVEQLPTLGADIVLVSSPPHHEAIMEGQAAGWRNLGLEVVDLCEGAKPHAPLFPLALKHRLAFDDSTPGTFRLTRPGSPSKTILLASDPWQSGIDQIKSFDYYFDAVVPSAVSRSEELVDFRKPSYHVLRRSGERFYFPSHPEAEETTESYLAFAQLQPGDHVVDLGAYAGVSTVLLSRAVGPEGRVVAVEPDSRNREALERNLGDYAIGNVVVDPAAVWLEDGEAWFQGEAGMSSSLVEVLGRSSLRAPVPTLTLETLVRRHRLGMVKFVKMDIEGAEVEVLRQAIPFLRRIKPRMVIEAHPRDNVSTLPEVVALLRASGFAITTLGEGTTDFPLVLAQ